MGKGITMRRNTHDKNDNISHAQGHSATHTHTHTHAHTHIHTNTRTHTLSRCACATNLYSASSVGLWSTLRSTARPLLLTTALRNAKGETAVGAGICHRGTSVHPRTNEHTNMHTHTSSFVSPLSPPSPLPSSLPTHTHTHTHTYTHTHIHTRAYIHPLLCSGKHRTCSLQRLRLEPRGRSL